MQLRFLWNDSKFISGRKYEILALKTALVGSLEQNYRLVQQ